MEITAYRTDAVVAGSTLTDILDRFLPVIKDRSVVAVTSKIISICEGRMYPNDGTSDKKDLIRTEADLYIEDPAYFDKYKITLTIKDTQLIASAGIDESNGNGMFILWPKEPYVTAALIWNHLKTKNRIDHLGVIITDSHTTPLRWGVTGTALSWCGFEPLYDYTGKPDIFGRPFKFEKTNLIDSLATASTLVMGEGNEQTPIAVMTDVPFLKYIDHPPTPAEIESLHIDMKDDIYAPILVDIPWKKR